MNKIDFCSSLLSKMKIQPAQDVDNELFNYVFDVMNLAEESDPQLYEAMLYSHDFHGKSKSCSVVCYIDCASPKVFENLKRSCKHLLTYIGKPHNPDSLLTFSSYGLQLKELTSDNGMFYAVLTTVKCINCQLTADFQPTLVGNRVRCEFTITLDKVF